MLSHDLKARLNPFKHFIDRHAVNPVYRTIEVGAVQIRACVAWGIIAAEVTFDIATPIYVDRAAFLLVVQSLPKSQEIKLSVDGAALAWACGNARGRLALAPAVAMPMIAWPDKELLPFPIQLRQAMELGSISCYTSALAAFGMFGIVFDQRETCTVSSTDNTSLSTGWIQTPLLPALPDISTLSPYAVNFLHDIIVDGGLLGSDSKAWYYVDDTYSCKVGMVPPVKSDLKSVRDKYASSDIVIPIPQEPLERYIKRALALSEAKQTARVRISIKGGQLILGFQEDTTTTDEYFVVDNVPDIAPIILSTSKTARALAHVNEIVLDHASRGVLLFRSAAFDYLLCGQVSNT